MNWRKSMDKKSRAIRVVVREVMRKLRNTNEATTTGNVAGYLTPYAFSEPRERDKKRKSLERMGYTIVENRWLELKKDVSRNTPRKIADGISHIRKQLVEIDRYLNWYGKLRTENEISTESYHKRTQKQLRKLKEQVLKVYEKLDKLSTDE